MRIAFTGTSINCNSARHGVRCGIALCRRVRLGRAHSSVVMKIKHFLTKTSRPLKKEERLSANSTRQNGDLKRFTAMDLAPSAIAVPPAERTHSGREDSLASPAAEFTRMQRHASVSAVIIKSQIYNVTFQLFVASEGFQRSFSCLDMTSCANNDFSTKYNGKVCVMGMGKQAKILNEHQLRRFSLAWISQACR